MLCLLMVSVCVCCLVTASLCHRVFAMARAGYPCPGGPLHVTPSFALSLCRRHSRCVCVFPVRPVPAAVLEWPTLRLSRCCPEVVWSAVCSVLFSCLLPSPCCPCLSVSHVLQPVPVPGCGARSCGLQRLSCRCQAAQSVFCLRRACCVFCRLRCVAGRATVRCAAFLRTLACSSLRGRGRPRPRCTARGVSA